jgi:hypothetical protein
MPERPVSQCKLNALTSSRILFLTAIGHLKGIEENTANTCTWPTVTCPTVRTTDTQVCEGCQVIGHHYTKWHNHPCMWDSEVNAHLLQLARHPLHKPTPSNPYECTVLHQFTPDKNPRYSYFAHRTRTQQ